MGEIKELEVQVLTADRYDNARPQVVIRHLLANTARSDLALKLIERWGMVAAIPDGEDSAGRATLRLLTPDEIVQRATETADIAISTLHSKGWFHKLPTSEEEQALAKKTRA